MCVCGCCDIPGLGLGPGPGLAPVGLGLGAFLAELVRNSARSITDKQIRWLDWTKVPGTGDLAADMAAIGQTAAEQGAPPADPVAPSADTPAETPTEGVEQVWAALVQAFDEALSGLLTSIKTTAQLPEPSPPNGNGVAYDKFMAIYNALRGQNPPHVDDVG